MPEELLTQAMLCPVLGLVRVATAARGVAAARAGLRIGGAAPAAAVHSTDLATIMAFGAAVRVPRISVNAGSSPGAGLQDVASTTIGTGVLGRPVVTEVLLPLHLIRHTRLVWNPDPTVPFPAELLGPGDALDVWAAPNGPIPPYPVASNTPGYPLHPPRGRVIDASRRQPRPRDTTRLEGAVADLATDTDRLELIARDALAAYGLPPETGLTLLNISENATYRLDDPGGGRCSVLRVHRPGYHSREAIGSELAWVQALRADGVVSTPAVLPATDGSLVAAGTHPDGERRNVVRFAWVDGVEPAGARLVDDFRTLGAITARLHRHARTWYPPVGFTRFRWDYETSIGPRGHWGRWQDGMGVGPAERTVLSRLDEVLRDRLARFGDGPDRFGLVHADMRLANLIVDPTADGAPGRDLPAEGTSDEVNVIDFDDCGLGWYLYDLGSSLSFIEHDPRVPALIDAWVAGYRAVAPLSPQEEAELPTFVLLRRLLLVAWIGSHSTTDLAQEMGVEFTRVSCDLAEHYLSRTPRP